MADQPAAAAGLARTASPHPPPRDAPRARARRREAVCAAGACAPAAPLLHCSCRPAFCFDGGSSADRVDGLARDALPGSPGKAVDICSMHAIPAPSLPRIMASGLGGCPAALPCMPRPVLPRRPPATTAFAALDSPALRRVAAHAGPANSARSRSPWTSAAMPPKMPHEGEPAPLRTMRPAAVAAVAAAPGRLPPSLAAPVRTHALPSPHRRLGGRIIKSRQNEMPIRPRIMPLWHRFDRMGIQHDAGQGKTWHGACPMPGQRPMPTRRTPSSRNPLPPCRGTCAPVLPLHPPRRPCYGWTRARARQGRTTTGL